MAPPPAAVVRRAPAQPRGWLATFLIVLLMLGIVVGGCAAAAALSTLPDKPVTVSHGVTLVVPADWEFAGRADPETILLSKGSASVGITVNDGTDVRSVLQQLRDQWAAQGTVSVGDIRAVNDVRGGAAGVLRFDYSGTFPDLAVVGPVEGEVTGVPGTSINVIFDAWAGKGQFLTVSGDVLKIIDGAHIP